MHAMNLFEPNLHEEYSLVYNSMMQLNVFQVWHAFRIRSCDHTCCKMYRVFIGVSFFGEHVHQEACESAKGAGTLHQTIPSPLLPTGPVDGSVFIVSDGTKSQMTPN